MELKIIEGVKVNAGDTLVVIPSTNLSVEGYDRLKLSAQKLGLKILVLPPDSKVFVKAPEPTLARLFSALRR